MVVGTMASSATPNKTRPSDCDMDITVNCVAVLSAIMDSDVEGGKDEAIIVEILDIYVRPC